jgi:RNA:NAD 2'-phosphotransferase (TPT1/KptA family)
MVVCVHGTTEKAWDIIQKEGLKPMTRNHIHFATGLPKEDGVISGLCFFALHKSSYLMCLLLM